MNYKTLISETKSVRDFKKTEVSQTAIEAIKEYAHNCKKLVPEIAVNVEVMPNNQVFEKLDTVAGYLGHMIDAPSYLFIYSEV